MGHAVVVVERRSSFSRHNVIKTWSNTAESLLGLGHKVFNPGFKPHGHAHIGTREIQLTLLKAGLLLGVTVQYETMVMGIVPWGAGAEDGSHPAATPNDGSTAFEVWTMGTAAGLAWRRDNQETAEAPGDGAEGEDGEGDPVPEELSLRPAETNADALDRTSLVDFYEHATSSHGAIRPPPSPPLPVSASGRLAFDALIVAEGESSRLIRNLGFDRHVTRFGPAIGIGALCVCCVPCAVCCVCRVPCDVCCVCCVMCAVCAVCAVWAVCAV